jgi:hypothetical protein
MAKWARNRQIFPRIVHILLLETVSSIRLPAGALSRAVFLSANRMRPKGLDLERPIVVEQGSEPLRKPRFHRGYVRARCISNPATEGGFA